jgi:hypothetical protein
VTKPTRWSVDIIRKRAEHLGEVDAPDEEAAITRAAEVFDIPVERQNRISVRRIGKGEKSQS